ncbi:MAG: glycosyltransferase family 39 protein [Lentisphaeria bacterium]|nr:glycosyltransferase family 39 protein [Lentisphaeria bacterium]
MDLQKQNIPANRLFLACCAAALLLHVLLSLQGLRAPDPAAFFSRPDTAGYLAPAKALASGNGFGGFLERAPGFPVLLAAVFRWPWLAELTFGLCGILTALPIYLAARKYAGNIPALLAAGLFLFNPTAMANRPLWLTDTFFGLFAAWQCYFLLEYLAGKRNRDWLITIAIAAVGTLIRPINLAWIAPALFIGFTMRGVAFRTKLFRSAAGLLLFLAILFPWQARNAALGAGYCIDINTGAMYHQNGAMLLAAVNRSSFEAEKAAILQALEKEFADQTRYPDAASRTDYRMKKFRELILQHPFIWLRQHFRLHVLLPDAPALCENMGLTSSGRGTLDVMQKQGVLAAVNHYFDNKWYIPLLLLPLLLPAALLIPGVLTEIWQLLRDVRKNYPLLLVLLACAEYYFFLPGPITVPRYQIPALPILCILGGTGLYRLYLAWKGKKAPEKNAPDLQFQEKALSYVSDNVSNSDHINNLSGGSST